MDVKQVIVIRSDLGMRRGKEIAQGAHASMAWLTRRLGDWESVVGELVWDARASFSAAEHEWLTGSFTKICCRVRSLKELLEVSDAARRAGLEPHLITDVGRTEFHDRPTVTAAAIGPDLAERIDPVTGQLDLY